MRKNKLITALRLAATSLEDGTFAYNWKNTHSCNCGVVACAITGMSASQLHNELLIRTTREQQSWKYITGTLCPITGIPEHKIFRALYEAGMTAKDIVQLETLSNPDVMRRMGFRQTEPKPKKRTLKQRIEAWAGFPDTPPDGKQRYEDPAVAAKYMRAWADMLAEEQQMDTPVNREQKVEA